MLYLLYVGLIDICKMCCLYGSKFYWDENGSQHNYECNGSPLPSGYCIFHDDSFLDNPSNEQTVRQEFMKKLNTGIKNKEELLFIGFILPHVELHNIVVENNIYFMYARFRGILSIQNCKFYKKVSFILAHFSKSTAFGNCIFTNKLEANDVIFFDTCKMYGNTFYAVDFLSATFRNDTYFNGSIFNGDAIFGYAEFNTVDFQNCVFKKATHFHFSKFNVEGKFDSVRFESFLLFNASYSNGLYFTNTTFDQLEFRLGWVNHIGQFWNSVFLSQVQFDDTIMKIADFRQCQFQGFLSFKQSGFENCDFSYSKFHDGAHYIETKFLGSQFNYVIFNKPREIIFQSLNLSNVSFANTDISSIHFGDNIKFGKDGYTIYEETLFTKDLESSSNISQPNTLDSILALYRNLRENFEFQLRYDEAGKFFVKEMELKRKYKEQNNRIIKRGWKEKYLSPTGIYFHLAEYGENEVKPLKLLIFFIGLSLIYWAASYPYTDENILYQIETEKMLSELITPLTNFTINNPPTNIFVTEYRENMENNWVLVTNIATFSFEKTMSNLFQVNDKSIWFDYIMRTIYLILLGLFFIALRRKLERRFRH